jgi:hypothetical protein
MMSCLWKRIKTMTLTVYIGGLADALATDELAPMMTVWYHVVRLKRKILRATRACGFEDFRV